MVGSFVRFLLFTRCEGSVRHEVIRHEVISIKIHGLVGLRLQ